MLRSIAARLESFSPNVHALVASAIAIVTLVVWLAVPSPAQGANAVDALADMATPDPLPNVPPAPPPALPSPATILAPVQQGDSLANIFARHGISRRDLHLVVNSGPLGKRLATIFPGHDFEFERDDEGNLLRLVYRPGRLETVGFTRVGDRFESSRVLKEPEKVQAFRSVTIERSLYDACQRVGLIDPFALRLTEIFQWDIDFILDVRPGDTFNVLYVENWLDSQFLENGEILAAEFVIRGKSYRAVRYGNGGAAGYYGPDGQSMRKAFLQAPLEYTRISSRFNLKRVHPLWKSSMPHRGIDYAAPTGTPVNATGDGVVTVVSRTAANGNYVVIRHGSKYQTKYLHLSAFAPNLKVGKSVKQGEFIGRVGATGWATGPHLHYEFLVDGVHQNPSTVAVPPASAISAEERATFDVAIAPLLAELTERKRSEQIAYQDAAP